MSEQGTLFVDPPKLTDRQSLALELIREHAPMSSDELGAYLHEDRMRRGGRGHAAVTTCGYCQQEGLNMGGRLRELGLVRFSRKAGGWYDAEQGIPQGRSTGTGETSLDPADSEIPF